MVSQESVDEQVQPAEDVVRPGKLEPSDLKKQANNEEFVSPF